MHGLHPMHENMHTNIAIQGGDWLTVSANICETKKSFYKAVCGLSLQDNSTESHKTIGEKLLLAF